MSFRCDAATLERLEWPALAECLAACASTARGAEACRGERFAPTRAAVAERLAETDEVRRLLADDADLPFGGVADLRASLEELRVGRALGAHALAELLETLKAARRLRTHLSQRGESAPRLAALADTLPELGGLS